MRSGLRSFAILALLCGPSWVSVAHAADGPNLVKNPGFDRDVGSWNPISSNPVWTSVNGGSAMLNATGAAANTPGDLRQCISISGLTAGHTYRWGGRVFIPPSQNRTGVGYMYLVWESRVDSFDECSGDVQVNFGGSTTTVGSWVPIDVGSVTAPAGAVGAQISFNIQKAEAAGTFSMHVDDAYLIETNVTPSVSISGPATGSVGDALPFQATATNCVAPVNGWAWTATGGGTISGGTTRGVSITWNAPGAYLVTAANSACGAGSATANVTISSTAANVAVTTFPRGLVQDAGVGGAADSFSVVNRGGTAASIALSQSGSFFTQSPTTFTLPAGGRQIVTLTGTAQPAGTYSGSVTVRADGVQVGSNLAVLMLVAARPSTPPVVRPGAGRVDVAADASSSPTGTATFSNTGSESVSAIVTSSVPWLIPDQPFVTIPAGGGGQVNFRIDRSARPDFSAPIGSVSGDLVLSFPSAASAKIVPLDTSPPPSVSTVTVVDTSKPTVSTVTLPPLGAGEVALFLSAVGHVTGSVGVFLSDVSLTNTAVGTPVGDIRLYYTTGGGGTNAQTFSIPSLPTTIPMAFGDLVKSVFGKSAEVGTLQVRASDLNHLAANATILNISNPQGTYGTSIPVFRSDRAVGAGGKLYLTGLKRDASSHTNLYLQETAGRGATVQIDFYDSAGAPRGSRSEVLGAFALAQLGSVVPQNAVSAVFSSAADSQGRFVAYATPVDEASGDTWSVVDWALHGGFSESESVVIPVAGAVHGANNTYFRTDAAVMNTGDTPASATVRYYNRTGEIVEKSLALPPLATRVYDDITSTLFGVTTDSVGYVVVIPSTGRLAITSRTYTTVSGGAATFGSATPTRSFPSSLRAGDLRKIGSVDDASSASIAAARPATFRTNLALVETAGAQASVRVTVRFSVAGAKVAAIYTGSKDYTLAPRELRLIGSVLGDVLGPERQLFGDLRNVQIEIAHIGGDGTVEIFTSSIDNGTGDSVLRTE